MRTGYCRGSEFSSYITELRKMTSNFELLTRWFIIYFSTFELLTRRRKIKSFTSSYKLEVEK